MEVKVVIPSHKRWDRVRTLQAVNNAILCVEESQVPMYRACNPKVEIVSHPDAVRGLAAKRDWILRYFGDVMMLDDDIEELRRVYEPPRLRSFDKLRVDQKNDIDNILPVSVDPDDAYAIIQMTAAACRDAGFYAFGFSTSPTPLHYDVFEPISLSGYLTGCAHGVLKGSKLWYNPEIICNEDYWLSCLNAHYHRIRLSIGAGWLSLGIWKLRRKILSYSKKCLAARLYLYERIRDE
jgi:hypothetical protein